MKINLKNGIKINHLKVTAIDSIKISGFYFIMKSNKLDRVDESIMIMDITTLKTQRFSAGKTVALVVGLTPVALLIYIIAHPFHFPGVVL